MSATTFTRSRTITSEQLTQTCATIIADKKAERIVALDLRGLSSFTDVYLLCSGTSEPHLKAIAGELEERMKKDHGIRPRRVDGLPSSHWVVADFGDVVVHIFHEEKRAYYSFEDLWSDAPRIKLKV